MVSSASNIASSLADGKLATDPGCSNSGIGKLDRNSRVAADFVHYDFQCVAIESQHALPPRQPPRHVLRLNSFDRIHRTRSVGTLPFRSVALSPALILPIGSSIGLPTTATIPGCAASGASCCCGNSPSAASNHRGQRDLALRDRNVDRCAFEVHAKRRADSLNHSVCRHRPETVDLRPLRL